MEKKWKTSIAAITATSGLFLTAALASDIQWDYEAPHEWQALHQDFAACAGSEQSPINLVEQEAHTVKPAEIEYHWTAFTPEVVNNGHTIQVNTGGNGGHVMLDGTRYDLIQFHFHAGSEHLIDGRQEPLEIHFVHASENGDLLVIGQFVQEGGANETIETLWNLIPEEGVAITGDTAIDQAALINTGSPFFRYKGSLTTPPCSEIVTWQVYAEPISVSKEQIEAFTALYSGNFRPVQEVGRRYVLFWR